MEKTDKMSSALKKYLGQYYRAKQKRNQLEKRLQTFREEMGSKGIQYAGMPSAGNRVGSDTEEQVMRAMEIEERITKQQVEVQRAMLDVLDVMDLLPLDSVERMILEYRYIDCLSWKQICNKVFLSRTSANDYYKKGIKELLVLKKVQVAIQKFDSVKEP